MKEQLQRYGYGLVIAIFVFLLSLFAAYNVDIFVKTRMDVEFKHTASGIKNSIEEKLEIYNNISESGVGLYASSNFVSRSEWETFFTAQRILEKYPSVRTIGYINVLSDSNKSSFIEDIRNEGFDSFDIYPAGTREEYAIVNYLVPFEGNEVAFGFDTLTREDRSTALHEARDTNSFVITSPIELVTDTADNISEYSFLGIFPVYKNDEDKANLEGRRENIQGYVSTVFKAKDMLSDIEKSSAEDLGLHFALTDVDTGQEFFSGGDHAYKDSAGNTEFEYLGIINIGSRSWEIIAHPSKLFIHKFDDELIIPKVIVGVGFLLSLMIFVFFVLLDRARRSAEVIADNMTANYKTEQTKVMAQKASVEEALEKTKESKKKVEEKVREIEKINETMVGREMKMIELKEQIKKLEEK